MIKNKIENSKKMLKRKNGITLIALIITIIILLILAGISIISITGKNGLLTEAFKAANEYNKKAEEELRNLNEIEKYFNNIENMGGIDETEKPKLPEVDTTTTIKYIAYNTPNTELGQDAIQIPAYKDNVFNDVFTVYNYKLIDQENAVVPEGYFSNHNDQYDKDKTRQLTYEFCTSCQEFEIQGVGAFRFSIWDDSKNKWTYIQSETGLGIDEQSDGYYLITFPDDKKRTVRIEALNAFYGLRVKKGEESKITKTTRKPGKKVLFVGNSWTNASLGTQIPGRYGRLYDSYVNVLSEALGFECINNGVGGTGYSVPTNDELYWYSSRIKDMLEKGVFPDILVFGGAGNDILMRADDPQKVADEAQNCIDVVRKLSKEKNKDLKIIIIGVEKVYGDFREEFSKSAEPMNEKLKEVALKNNIPYIDFLTNTTIASDGKTITKGETPFVLREYIGDDNLHPTLEGHKIIGLRLAEEVQALLKYENWK